MIKNVLAHVTESNIVSHATEVVTEPGIGSVRQHSVMGRLNEQIEPVFGTGPRIQIGLGPIVVDASADGFHNQAFWDLVSFFVAHPGRDKISADKARLQSLLTAALPLADTIDEVVTGKDLVVVTPAGRFSLADLGMKLTTTGFVTQSRYSIMLSAGKPSIPNGVLKPWMMTLMPTDFSIGADVSGLDLEGAVKIAIADFDPMAKDLLPAASFQKLNRAALAGGPLKLTFQPSHVTSALYTIDITGEAVFATDLPPALHMRVSAKGIDAAMDALNAAKDTDPTAEQALRLLTTAKGFGKAGESGAMQ